MRLYNEIEIENVVRSVRTEVDAVLANIRRGISTGVTERM